MAKSRAEQPQPGAPAQANTVLELTERKSVLLPDIFDPLTMSRREVSSTETLLGTHSDGASSGCCSASARNRPEFAPPAWGRSSWAAQRQ